MAFLQFRFSITINVIIFIKGLIIGGFLLLFGVANLINPDVPDAYLAQNTKICLLVCSLGVIFFLLSIAALRGIILKIREKRENQ